MIDNKKEILAVFLKKIDLKTASVIVERIKKHPVYKKYIRIKMKYLIHCEDASLKTGDKICIAESRPISKNKNKVFVRKVVQ